MRRESRDQRYERTPRSRSSVTGRASPPSRSRTQTFRTPSLGASHDSRRPSGDRRASARSGSPKRSRSGISGATAAIVPRRRAGPPGVPGWTTGPATSIIARLSGFVRPCPRRRGAGFEAAHTPLRPCRGPPLIALLFPGQGAQQVGMGRALSDAFPAARRTFEEADDLLGYRLSRLCFEGPAEELASTRKCQPAILTTSVAAWRVAHEHGVTGDIAMGHS